MNIKPKPIYVILLKMLKKEFMKDFEQANCCASDQIRWHRQSEESMDKLFKTWLVKHEYFEDSNAQ